MNPWRVFLMMVQATGVFIILAATDSGWKDDSCSAKISEVLQRGTIDK
ncbi:hypothetical protein [Undibacterium danionis]|uniref:Uncharacterized protein n=1 Tax=Undibacterium danionis TaxID=1812100 RepID=A0ABV6IES3_9BURK